MEAAMTMRKPATAKVVLWVALGSIVMLFAGLTSGYIVRMAEGKWKLFDIPQVFYISTAVILLSSITMHLSIVSVRNNDLPAVKRWLIVTLGLGLVFAFCQFLGWNQLVSQGVHFVDKTTPSGSFFYAITGLHLAHVAGGIIALMVTAGKSIMEKYNSGNYLGISLTATYWHFMDGLWIYLFVFLAVFR
jgi:cytochrome c oxidase subunit III